MGNEPVLCDWGPYTKRYAGISHIADASRGIRFDLSVFPGLYRRKVDVPNVTWESGFHPWEASADLSYYSFRHEVLWKDQVYCDIAYVRLADNAVLIRCEMVNNTRAMEEMVLHRMAYINYPTQAAHSHAYVPMTVCRVVHPDTVLSLHALDYQDMGYATPRPTDTLVPDGLKRGELRYTGLVRGSGLGVPKTDPRLPMGFGLEAGDWVRYGLDGLRTREDVYLKLRYAQWERDVVFDISGAAEGSVVLAAGEGLQTVLVRLGTLAEGQDSITLTARGGAPVLLDSVLLGALADLEACAYVEESTEHTPDMKHHEDERILTLRYESCACVYGLSWGEGPYWVREILNSELDSFMRANVHHHTNSVMVGDRKGHFANVFQRPIPLPAGSTRVLYGLVAGAESEEAVLETLRSHGKDVPALEALYESARASRVRFDGAADEAMHFSQERMAATVLTNQVFPIYTQGRYIRHTTPGRWWDCLYTWDSGFVGLGLNTVDPELAIACLRTYLTPVDDPHHAFIHHGSMVPTQFWLLQEIWNRTQSRPLLESTYAQLRRYYAFYVGRLGSSTTASMRSGLLKTWDYFYNSGGWDDYPPQVHVHRNRLTATVSPCVNTAHAIRCARILEYVARELGDREAECAAYAQDAARLMQALQQYAYDADSGYFSYVVHDADGRPVDILRHAQGQNFNMGLDGVSPLFTGLLPDEQADRLVELLMTPGRLWCSAGLST
ncbi:MAG TPA: hypothetical protein PKE04_15870, partial [Clostridia bacterium]|nr:hypothetical protein [Clostridia bacterium]